MENEKEYFLKKVSDDEEFGYIDQNGVSHNSPIWWLWDVLGGCGCGNSERLSKEAFKVLELFATDHMLRTWSVYDDRFYEVIAHWMDKEEIIEHGGNIGGSWLTEKGEQIYNSIKKCKK